MARSGAFLDLEPYLQADASYRPEDYLPAAMTCCRFDQKQYLLPVGLMLMLNEHTRQTAQEQGIVQGKTSLDDYYTMLDTYEKAHRDEAGVIAFFRCWIDYMDGIGFSPAHQMLALCGVDPDEIDDSDSSGSGYAGLWIGSASSGARTRSCGPLRMMCCSMTGLLPILTAPTTR